SLRNQSGRRPCVHVRSNRGRIAPAVLARLRTAGARRPDAQTRCRSEAGRVDGTRPQELPGGDGEGGWLAFQTTVLAVASVLAVAAEPRTAGERAAARIQVDVAVLSATGEPGTGLSGAAFAIYSN